MKKHSFSTYSFDFSPSRTVHCHKANHTRHNVEECRLQSQTKQNKTLKTEKHEKKPSQPNFQAEEK
jgi:hypothetical protein